MRGKSASRMLALATMQLAALIFANGCRSVSLPTGLSTDAPAKMPAKLPEPHAAKDPLAGPAVATEVVWKKSPFTPSSAAAPDGWNEPVRPVAHQGPPLARQEPAPLPELMPRDKAEALGSVQPTALRHGPRVAAKSIPPMVSADAPNEANRVTLPTYRLRPPDVLIIESRKGLTTQPIFGQHLVRPDGTVGLGAYPPAQVAGLTLGEARAEIAKAIHSKMAKEPYEIEDPPKSGKFIKVKPPTEEEVRENLSVDVLAYNSSVYYVIFDGAGLGEQVYRFPVTGNETVLDAISNVNGLPLVASRRIWVARRNEEAGGAASTLPVDWKGITQGGSMNTNWQLMPGDRIYVQADSVRRFNNNLGKFLEPIERVMGATLLSGQTINTIRNGTNVIR